MKTSIYFSVELYLPYKEAATLHEKMDQIVQDNPQDCQDSRRSAGVTAS